MFKMLNETITKFEKHVLSGIDADEVISLLQEIIRQRSDYPPGDCRDAVRVVDGAL